MSLAVRLSAAFVGLVAVTALLFGVAGVVSAERGVSEQLDRFLTQRAEDIIGGQRSKPDRPGDRERDNRDGGVEPATDVENSDAIADAVDADTIVQILAADGTIEASTGMALPVDDQDRRLAADDSRQSRLRTVDTDSGPHRMVTAGDPQGGAVQVARELEPSSTAVNLIRSQLVVAVPVLALVAGLAGLVLARRITRPIRALASAVDTVAETGDLSVPIDASGHDEVGRLATGFDKLLHSLAESRRQQQRLVQDAAHELRTPLTSVKANVDLLSAAPDLDTETRSQVLGSLRRELNELNVLVTEIVDAASDRHRPRSSEPIDLAEVAAESIERFEARTGRSVIRHLSSAMVVGDRESLIRAVDNLLSNADTHTHDDGPITVTVTADGTVAVADRGEGIPPAERERVFDRFYRSHTARSRPGSGLGLSIVKSIVNAHGGTVAIEDNAGGGAIVALSIPLAQATVE